MASSSFDPAEVNNDQSPFLVYPSLLAINGKIAISALAVLLFASFGIIALRFYSRWSIWRRHATRSIHPSPFNTQQQPTSCSTGLHGDIVESLPTFHYKCDPFHMAADADLLPVECAVCLCEFQENEKCRLLPKCNHSFHTHCIDMWFLTNSTCPLCRSCAYPSADEDDLEKNTSIASLLRHRDEGNRQYQNEVIHDIHISEAGDAGERRNRGHSIQQMHIRDDRECPFLFPTNDRFSRPREVVQFPTNVLFWGNDFHVNSRENSDIRVPDGRSLPQITLSESRQDLLASASSTGFLPSHECRSGPSTLQQYPSSRLKSLKRLLTREKKLAPSDASTSSHGAGLTAS